MATVAIKVREIHCESCADTIRAALSQLEGVREVRPSHQSSQVQVLFDEARVVVCKSAYKKPGTRRSARRAPGEPVIASQVR